MPINSAIEAADRAADRKTNITAICATFSQSIGTAVNAAQRPAFITSVETAVLAAFDATYKPA
jgi:hypothetical protein